RERASIGQAAGRTALLEIPKSYPLPSAVRGTRFRNCRRVDAATPTDLLGPRLRRPRQRPAVPSAHGRLCSCRHLRRARQSHISLRITFGVALVGRHMMFAETASPDAFHAVMRPQRRSATELTPWPTGVRQSQDAGGLICPTGSTTSFAETLNVKP